MRSVWALCVFFNAALQPSSLQPSVPETAWNCCEGDLLLLLDSSGSVANHEFSRLLRFAADLLRPFRLGAGHVRVGLLQVGTEPKLEFGLDAHAGQESLQRALRGVAQLQGSTNTAAALALAERLMATTGTKAPKVLLWLTDGVQPGDVDGPLSELKALGVSVLAVSTVHGNFQVLQRAVSPPPESHLYSVDFESIDIITRDVRDAIIRIIQAERLRVANVTSRSAVVQWRPVLSGDSGFYDFRYRAEGTADGETWRILPGNTVRIKLDNLQPLTTYTASLRPESNQRLFDKLSVSFTTLPEVVTPAVVSVSHPGPGQTRVSWGPLLPDLVRGYRVEYGALPGGRVQTVTVPGHLNSTLLTGLEQGTEYLITVSAVYVTGAEKAMSVRACTQEAPPALPDLQLTPAEKHGALVSWRSPLTAPRGYWLSWEQDDSVASVYLAASSRSTRLANLRRNSRVCVSPVYSSGRGVGLCCAAQELRG